MKNIYCLSGLGADERIFANLAIKGHQLVHLPWIKPLKDETLPQYALRMGALIQQHNPIILGLSFGGMLATEIAKAIPISKAILISSAKTAKELPALNSALLSLVRSQLLPSFMFSIPNPYICHIFGTKTAEERKLLNGIIRDADGSFVKWASRAIVNWDNQTIPPNILHIHGTNDKVLLSALATPHYWIEGGTHLMAYNRAAEISAIIEKELAQHP